MHYRTALRRTLLALALLLLQPVLARPRAAVDAPFTQPVSIKYQLPPDLRGAATRLEIDRDGIVYILTRKGVARLFGDRIALDQSYRPLAGRVAHDLTTVEGDLVYLFPEEVLSNRRAGKFVHRLAEPFERLAMNSSGIALLTRGNAAVVLKDGRILPIEGRSAGAFDQVVARGNEFIGRAGDDIYRIGTNIEKLANIPGLNVLTVSGNQLYLGLETGLVLFDPESGSPLSALISKVPSTNITALDVHGDDVWAGTTRGVWRMSAGTFRYFASRRWLDQDQVIDLKVAPGGSVFVLTAQALNEIQFRQMTLAEKAAGYDTKIRQRHIRYGFAAELRLASPGDITSAEMIDTDNDGTWSNYYMASQAFRFGATGDPEARRNAWETFEALERLESINPLEGFPSRTFERVGYKVSDPERWHPVGDGIWDWKAHTSSDEVAAHMFGSAVLYETTARTAAEKERIARFIERILDHIVRHDWYLIDVDGQPTLWARWNPEYVNAFPESMFDRRLNSAEIIAALQLGYAITGKTLYKEKALELMERHGYLRNILLPMSGITYTPGFKHKGIEMGMDWNHSDDLLAFVTYWVLHRFAFDNVLRAKYEDAIRDHWQLERHEQCPLWNFIYASTGATDFDLDGALWTLRGFPLDLVDWTITNSHRRDITRLESNFRFQELRELLPPDERRITRWNGQPFILDGGRGGRIELAGDEFLLPYWMGRYLNVIR